MSSIDINSQLADLNLCKANGLSTEPVTLKHFVRKAIQSKSVVKCVVYKMLGEHTHPTAEHSAAISHTNVLQIHHI